VLKRSENGLFCGSRFKLYKWRTELTANGTRSSSTFLSKLMNILLPQTIASEAVHLIEQADHTVMVAPHATTETILPLIKDAHGLILRTGISITSDLLSEAERLLIIARTGAGLDNVDVEAATEKQIIVTSNLGVNTISVTEHILALILAISKKLRILDMAVRSYNFGIRYQNLPRDLNEKKIGLLGFGRIGSEVARICHQIFSMQVAAFDPYLSDDIKATYAGWVKFVDMDTLFSISDVLSIHVPLTKNTHHLVGRSHICMMKRDAVLINTSRGGIVDESALIKALQDKKIAGAALDVFSEEPVPADNPLLKLENVILTPHTAALTSECVTRMAIEAAQCVLDVFAGIKPPNVANQQVLESQKWGHLRGK
jgi:D-3-phosphoglycerate dehydrogenase